MPTKAQLRVLARSMGVSLAEARKYANDAPRRNAAAKAERIQDRRQPTYYEGTPNPLTLHDPEVVVRKLKQRPVMFTLTHDFDKPTIANFAICRPNETPPCAVWMTDEGIEYVAKVHSIGMTRKHELQIEVDTDHDWYMQIFVVSPDAQLTEPELQQLTLDAMAALPDEYINEFRARKFWASYGKSPLQIGVPSWGL